MELTDIIKDKFANLQADRAHYLGDEYDAWVIVFSNGSHGVAIKYDGDLVNESFANVKYYSTFVKLAEQESQFLILASSIFQLRNEFAIICANLVDPKFQDRELLLKDPLTWWKNWRELLGNAVKIPKSHSLIGELLSVNYLLENELEPKWKPTDYSTHDIFVGDESYEVKSTTSKYSNTITISSQYQLRDPDFLLFCKLEKSNTGFSINDLVKMLNERGLEENFLNDELDKLGFPEGASSRGDKYKLLEMRLYDIDDQFPGKELSDFLSNYSDPSVQKVTYEIDLKGQHYKNITKENLGLN